MELRGPFPLVCIVVYKHSGLVSLCKKNAFLALMEAYRPVLFPHDDKWKRSRGERHILPVAKKMRFAGARVFGTVLGNLC